MEDDSDTRERRRRQRKRGRGSFDGEVARVVVPSDMVSKRDSSHTRRLHDERRRHLLVLTTSALGNAKLAEVRRVQNHPVPEWLDPAISDPHRGTASECRPELFESSSWIGREDEHVRFPHAKVMTVNLASPAEFLLDRLFECDQSVEVFTRKLNDQLI